MTDLLRQYKGEQSNYDCIRDEIKNLLEELEDANRIKVDNQFCEDVLQNIKEIRLSIIAIRD